MTLAALRLAKKSLIAFIGSHPDREVRLAITAELKTWTLKTFKRHTRKPARDA